MKVNLMYGIGGIARIDQSISDAIRSAAMAQSDFGVFGEETIEINLSADDGVEIDARVIVRNIGSIEHFPRTEEHQAEGEDCIYTQIIEADTYIYDREGDPINWRFTDDCKDHGVEVRSWVA